MLVKTNISIHHSGIHFFHKAFINVCAGQTLGRKDVDNLLAYVRQYKEERDAATISDDVGEMTI